ncbi:Hsp20/alpha crystallin family protein [Haloarchaeobius sp. TZWWS8]|uniref:Hsp20/alpha crystallin family protein n=1 Tax=Haloarchaeobius sp. TZWWS8 TaxID=3446121 RepID=UPI003EB7BE34
MRRNPFEEIEDMFDRMGRQFESGPGMRSFQSVPIDLQDLGDAYELAADLPGYRSDDIDLTFSDGSLNIDATREETEDEADGGRYVHRERRESVSRRVRIPEPVDESGISASYNNGTLTVKLPKEEQTEDEGHRINIE